MLRLLADENISYHIVRALQIREPAIDIVRVQDVGLAGTDDPVILEWAAQQARVLVTHDASTMTRYAYDRVAAQQPMPGVIEVNSRAPLGEVIDDLLLTALCSFDGEWQGRVIFVPLR